MPLPLTTASAPQTACARHHETLVARLYLLVHVSHVEVRDDACVREQSRRGDGIVGVDVDLQRRRVADDQHRIADPLELGDELTLLERGAADGEVRAVTVGRRRVLRMRHAGGGVVLDGRRFAAAKRAHDPGQKHGHGVAAGVDDTGIAQHRQQVGAAPHRLLPCVEGLLDHACDHLVLLDHGRVDAEPGVMSVGQLRGDAVGHLAHDGQDRALGRLAHRPVCLVGGARERRPDQHRIDELSWPTGELFGRAANQLREDHAGIAAGSEQCGPRDRRDDLVAPDLIDRAALRGARKAVQLLKHGAQRQHHVVAGIAVGDREHVEVVDLLTALLERRQPSLDHCPKPNDARVGHAGPAARSVGSDHLYLALTILPAFRQRVHT